MPPNSYLTEQALRMAVNTTDVPLKAGSEYSKEIENAAVNRVTELLKGNSTVSTLNSQLDLERAAISTAVVGIQLSYNFITSQVNDLNNKRLSFDRERQMGTVSFLLPKNKEEGSFSSEEQVINAFLNLADSSIFSSYLGIQRAEVATPTPAIFYSILPFYKMSEALAKPVASKKPVEVQRTAINLFFKSAMPDAIAGIDYEFQTENRILAFLKSIFQKENYLNNLRAPRFIMMALSNLLWNLLHPVDPKTGYPLSNEECVELCRSVELFINQLLNKEASPYLQNISNAENQLISFVRKIEIQTKALRRAYNEEFLHEFNLSDVINSSNRVLRIMDKCVFKLIYKKDNPLTNKKESNKKAAEDLAYTISYLNQLLNRNDHYLEIFNHFTQYVPSVVRINRPVTTVIDVLIIMTHLPSEARFAILEQLLKQKLTSSFELAETLKALDDKFIKPIREVSEKDLGVHSWSSDNKRREVAKLTAKRLLPLMTLVIEDYRIAVDTEYSIRMAKQYHVGNSNPKLIRGEEQVQAINEEAANDGGYFVWKISPFVPLSEDKKDKIDLLPPAQYRMTQMTKLLDAVEEIVNHYRHFLQQKGFQSFLNLCLAKVTEEYDTLEEQIEGVDALLSKDEAMNRNLQDILRPMIAELRSSLNAFNKASINFERYLNEPDFTENQKQIMAGKLNAVEKQFATLYGDEKLNLTSLVDLGSRGMQEQPSEDRHVAAEVSPDLPEPFQANKAIMLSRMVQRCYDALSHHSRIGNKGHLLKELLSRIDCTTNFNDKKVKEIVLELARVTACYRKTWYGLFQAEYGKTRSAIVLAEAVKDPSINSVLPLASILFGDSVDLNKLKQEDVIHQLIVLRDGRKWKSASDEVIPIQYGAG